MRNTGKVIAGVIVLITLLSAIETASAQYPEDVAYVVKAGDRKSFMITNLHNGAEESLEGPLFDENTNVTLEKGTQITIEIIGNYNSSNYPYTDGQVSYRVIIGDFASGELGLVEINTYLGVWFIPTVDNRSYWEELVRTSQETQGEFDSGYSMSLEGSLLVTNFVFDEYEGQITEYCMKWSWKTGWMEYMYLSTNVGEDEWKYEIEIQAETYKGVQVENILLSFTGFLEELSTGIVAIVVAFASGGSMALIARKAQR